MKLLKRLFYFIFGLFFLLCATVLIFAMNPELSEKTADFLYGSKSVKESYRPEGTAQGPGSTSEQGTEGSLSPGEDMSGEGNSPEEGMEGEITYPFPGQPIYNLPEDTEISVPDAVLGKNGYIPVEGISENTQPKDYISNLGTGETGENLTFDSEIYPHYWMLNDNLKAFYKQIYANAMALNASFEPVVKIHASQITTALEAVYNDHPELFWLDTSFSYLFLEDGRCAELYLEFNRAADNIDISKSSFSRKANEIISGALRYTDDYGKERYVHDALLARIKYSLTAPMNQSAYSALVEGETVCAGYARAFQYILQQLRIPCYYVTGIAGENHAWNIVKLEGNYYNVDLTWNDTGPNSQNYFNKTDDYFSKTHIRTGLSVYLPACEGGKYVDFKWQPPKEEEPKPPKKEETDSPVVSGPNANYKGAVLKSLQEYYDNCYVQLLKGDKGTFKFINVVSPKVLEELYAAYNKEEYTNGYMDKLLKEKDAKGYTIQIEQYASSDENFVLEHTIVFY